VRGESRDAPAGEGALLRVLEFLGKEADNDSKPVVDSSLGDEARCDGDRSRDCVVGKRFEYGGSVLV
jgi:hypothetical protein